MYLRLIDYMNYTIRISCAGYMGWNDSRNCVADIYLDIDHLNQKLEERSVYSSPMILVAKYSPLLRMICVIMSYFFSTGL